MKHKLFVLGLLIVAAGLAGWLWVALGRSDTPEETINSVAVPEPPKTIVAAGDISCVATAAVTDFTCRSKDTAALIETIDPDAVLTAGDNQYPKGTLESYQTAYDKTWGAFKEKTYPTAGNHEYATPGGQGYYEYFGERAGERDKGYYTFTVGKWRLFALNSEIDVSATSPQLAWLKEELSKNPTTCSLAYWHKPRFSTGLHPSDATYDALWRVLYDHNVDIIINGHSHNYERFVAQNPDGQADPQKGITQFVAGMGGYGPQAFGQLLPTLATRQNHSFGVLLLELHNKRASYQFMPIAGNQTFIDEGSIACH